MSRKKKRNQGTRSPNSDNNPVRRQKAARYADKSFKNHTSENSPMGNSEYEGSFEDTAKQNNVPNPHQKKRSKHKQQATYFENHSISNEQNSESVTINESEENSNADTLTRSDDSDRNGKMANRMKKAAYVKQMNEIKILAEMTANNDEELPGSDVEDQSETADMNDVTNGNEDSAIAAEKSPTPNSPVTDKSEYKQIYTKELAVKQYKNRQSIGKNNASNIQIGAVKATEETAEFVSAVQSENAANVVSLPVKHLIEDNVSASSTAKTVDSLANSAKNSDSVGSAVMNVGTAVIANEVRNYANERLFGESETKSYTSDRLSEESKINDRKIRKRRENPYRFINVEDRKSEQTKRYKVKSFETKTAVQKEQQKNVYLKENKDNISSAPKETARYIVKKKLFNKLIIFATPLIMPILIILIVIILISSLFSWLSPFKFSLAGDESDGPETSAETSAEVLDGYTLMIRNYLDVAQAYYYLNYGDWYGGTYYYPSAESEIAFSDFFAAKCEYIISSIQQQFSSALANAQSPEEAAAISSAMGQAISNALAQAQEEAIGEYQALVEGLNDCLRAEEKRQHYEIVNNGGSNGIPDSEEFNGYPIEGTNLFGNVEIKSDLSAEELLAMTALYKTLLLVQSEGKTNDGTDYVYNITPEDIMQFFNDTEYIPITAEITHDNPCEGDCKRHIVGDYESGYSWEYYCDNDHDNLIGSIGDCISKDELIQKIMELTEAEDNGFDSDKCEDMIDEYIKLICDELEIDEGDFRQFGAADNERAKGFYETLIDPTKGIIPNNYWKVETPVVGEESEGNSSE